MNIDIPSFIHRTNKEKSFRNVSLERVFPGVTQEEIYRFSTAFPNKFEKKLHSYLHWKTAVGLISDTNEQNKTTEENVKSPYNLHIQSNNNNMTNHGDKSIETNSLASTELSNDARDWQDSMINAQSYVEYLKSKQLKHKSGGFPEDYHRSLHPKQANESIRDLNWSSTGASVHSIGSCNKGANRSNTGPLLSNRELGRSSSFKVKRRQIMRYSLSSRKLSSVMPSNIDTERPMYASVHKSTSTVPSAINSVLFPRIMYTSCFCEEDAIRRGIRIVRVNKNNRSGIEKYPDRRIARSHLCHSNTNEKKSDTMTDLDGNIVIQVLAGHIDLDRFCADTYANAFAIYLSKKLDLQGCHYPYHNEDFHSKLSRQMQGNSPSCCTILLDVRAIPGSANLPASSLLSFIRHCVDFLMNVHPMRLKQCLIYPVPSVAMTVWLMIKPLLPRSISDQIVLLQTPHQLKQYLPLKTIEIAEMNYRSNTSAAD